MAPGWSQTESPFLWVNWQFKPDWVFSPKWTSTASCSRLSASAASAVLQPTALPDCGTMHRVIRASIFVGNQALSLRQTIVHYESPPPSW